MHRTRKESVTSRKVSVTLNEKFRNSNGTFIWSVYIVNSTLITLENKNKHIIRFMCPKHVENGFKQQFEARPVYTT